jgi:hypothetical protein
MPASVQLHALPHCNSNGRFTSISIHFAPVGALQRVTAKTRHPHEIAHCRAEVLHDAANLAKCCAMVNPHSRSASMSRATGRNQTSERKSHGQKASAQTASMEQRS